MATPKPVLLTVHTSFHLPAVLFTLLAALAITSALPVGLSFWFSAADLPAFSFVPRLWNAFLAWLTPPCVFIYLNGIIFGLTASSGMLSGSDLPHSCPHPVEKLQGPQEEVSQAPSVDLSVEAPLVNLPVKAEEYRCQVLETDASVLSKNRPCDDNNAHGISQEEEVHFFDTQDGTAYDEETDASKLASENENLSFCCTDRTLKQEGANNDDKNDSETENVSFCCTERTLKQEGANNDDNNDLDGWPSKEGMVIKRTGLFYREEGDLDRMKTSRSMAMTSQLVTSPNSNSIKRSRSVDSAPYGREQPPSAETLSDEAFKKRIEDFISMMNAQMRKEVK